MSTHRIRFLHWWLLPILAAGSKGQSAPSAVAEKTLELPAMTITGSRELPPPESWQYAQVEGFEVLSNASARETTRILGDFQKFRQMLAVAWPGAVAKAGPSSLILCGRANKFADFVPAGSSAAAGDVSLFLRDGERSAIVLDLGTTVVTASADSTLIVPGQGVFQSGVAVDHVRQLQREYVRFLLAQSRFKPPPWLIEGFTQVVMDIEFTDRWVTCGKLPKTRPPAAVGDAEGDDFSAETEVGDLPFNAALQMRALMPLEKFFALPADDPAVRNPLGQSLWAKQAYAFVHLCMFRADEKLQKPFARFIQRLQNEPLDEKLFQECFGLSYREMEGELRSYITFTQYKYHTTRLEKADRITVTDAVLRPATEAEIGRIKGDAQRLAGRPADALVTYGAAYARGERTPALLAAFGVAEYEAGQTEPARKLLEAAAKLDADRPSAWVALARMRLAQALATPAGPDRGLSDQQMASVLEPLFKARTLAPPNAELYELMAETWMQGTPPRDGIGVLVEGVRKFPASSRLTLLAAQVYARAGDPLNAAELARIGLRFARDEAMRTRFRDFLVTLPAPVPSTGEKPGPASS